MLVCFEWSVIMSAYDTLCVSVSHPETSCHAVAGHEVSGFHFPCKESLGEKSKSTFSGRSLANDYNVL